MSDTKTSKVIILPLGKLTKEISLEVAQPVKERGRERGREIEKFFFFFSFFLYSIRVLMETSLKEVDCFTAF